MRNDNSATAARRSRRRLLGLAAVVATVGLVGAACGGSKGSDTGSSSSSGASSAKLSAATLNGSGSTFQLAFDEAAIAQFKEKQPAVTVNYGGGGSGKGKQDLADQIVDFAGTDSLVKPEDASKYKGGEFLYIPTVAAPITVSYNLKGVSDLKLDADTIAKIFSRQIKTWDDPAIKATNSGATLPSTAITVVHRSDASGTTENFTKFLAAASPTSWTIKAGSTVDWPTDTQAGNGNQGVASAVKSTDGAIGYVDLSDAKASGLTFAQVKNKAGNFEKPTLEGASKALDGATVNADLTYNPLWTDGADAYPITSPTWVLVYKNQTDKAKGEAVKAFLTYLVTDAQDVAKDVDYAKLPASLQAKAKAAVDSIVVGGSAGSSGSSTTTK
ncbi:MAG TPA: phosphate ABC transporter substrate-binding protein PstS [Acidimicrobiales bacterium]|nr:phosphate ABC transporter substrate-binding protein PstS [Acidimicrobiales bacterium]